MILPKLAVLSGRQHARLSQYFLSEAGTEWEEYSEKEVCGWVQRVPGNQGWETLEVRLHQGRGLYREEGVVLGPPSHPTTHPTPIHPPIGIINTLFWQAGVGMLF